MRGRFAILGFCLGLLPGLLPYPAPAQMSGNNRQEWKVDQLYMEDQSEQRYVLPSTNRGVLIIRNRKRYRNHDRKEKFLWQFQYFDTSLAEQANNTYPISRKLEFELFYPADSAFYLLFRNIYNHAFTLLRYSPTSRVNRGHIQTFFLDMPGNFHIRQLKVRFPFFYLLGQTDGQQVGLRVFEAGIAKGRNFQELFFPNGEVHDFQFGPQGDVWMAHSLRRRGQKQAYLLRFSPKGSLKDKVPVQIPKPYEIGDAKVMPLNNDTTILIGTCPKEGYEYPQGLIFFSKNYQKGQPEAHRFLPFHRFSNIFLHNLLELKRDGRLHRAKRRNKRKQKKKEAKDYYFRDRLLMHKPRAFGDSTLLFVAESFLPVFQSSLSQSSTGAYYFKDRGREVYRYTHALVALLDHQGRIRYDASFPLADYQIGHKQQTSVDVIQPPVYKTLYPGGENQLFMTEVYHQQDSLALNTFAHRGALRKDQVKKTLLGGAVRFTDDAFLFWGTQRIKNPFQGDKVRVMREVFFLEKRYTYQHQDQKKEKD